MERPTYPRSETRGSPSPGPTRQSEPTRGAAISSVRGTALHQAGVDLYRRHHGGPDGLCRCCGRPSPCSSRALGASVIETAGEDPRRYDTDGGTPAGATGYRLGGFGRRSEIPNFDYER
jgi:hypothetical protein